MKNNLGSHLFPLTSPPQQAITVLEGFPLATKPQVHILDDGYRLSIDGVTSEKHDFGDAIEMSVGGKRYLCLMDLPEDEEESTEVESPLNNWVYEVTPVEADIVDIDESPATMPTVSSKLTEIVSTIDKPKSQSQEGKEPDTNEQS